jgi:plastocyanin
MRSSIVSLLAVLIAVVLTANRQGDAAAVQAGRGTITGHVRLMGKLPGNPIIRMGKDPLCAKMNAGKRVIQETVVAAADGSLANAFIELQGQLAPGPGPTGSVTIEQRGCVYSPRVVGVRVGQTLQVKNSDELMHNVHSLSTRGNGFNVSEPKAGMVQEFRLKDEEIMLRLKCDVHSWMAAFVGVVSHPYFAVTGTTGTFEIAGVPAGTHTIQAWHERYGMLSQKVRVQASATTTVNFAYTGSEQPPAP